MDLLTGPAAGPTLGVVCALGAALTWALTGLLVRSLIPLLGSVALNALRAGLGGALLLAWVVATGGLGGLAAVSAESFLLLALSIVVAIGIGDTVFFESTRSLGLARAMTISMTYPVGAALLAAVFLGEAVTRPVAAGTLLTLGGLVLIVGRQRDAVAGARPGLGVAAAALASLAWAVSVVLLRRPLGEVDPVTAQAIRLPIAAGLLWLTPWARGAVRDLRSGGRPALARMALLSGLTALSSVLFVASIKYAGVAVGAVLSSTAPLFAIPLGFVFLGERLAPAAIAGAVMTVIGIVVIGL